MFGFCVTSIDITI